MFSLGSAEAGLRLAGLIYNETRPSVFGGEAGGKAARTVLCVGDSYTYGGNVTGKQAYPSPLWLKLKETAPGIRVVNRGHCEYNTSQILAELPGDLSAFKPDVVILLAGSSDRWNIIGAKPGDKTFIYRPDYNGSLYDDSLWPSETQNAFMRLRVYKMARAIYLNAKFRYLLRNAAAIDPKKLAAGYKARNPTKTCPYMAAMYYTSCHEGLELALALRTSVGSAYYSHNLLLYRPGLIFRVPVQIPGRKVERGSSLWRGGRSWRIKSL